ncbi:hypothetical protein KM800_10750 [Clostridium tyrobutyricum]|uniref:glycan biosynthesis hexose transferase WsfD n=1 Tax=Clostridium tyrobutyricum TaxID=1519 RepID=UPI001C392243|nr:hypothetical protein [Clostridium tyrobutyricum]MBV4419794.1 hypothetical protein [Clostridium tyrobutyricum]
MKTYLKKKMNYGLLAAVMVLFICAITLFVRPIVGMADNGDFFRIMSQSDLYYMSSSNKNRFLGYFTKDYGIYRYNNDNAKIIVSTQLIFTKVAVFIAKLLTEGYIFDIRILAFLYTIVYAAAAYLIVNVMTVNLKSHKYKLLITALFVFIFCDTGYIAYFNSFFAEAVNLSFFLLSLGILLYIYKFKKYTIINLILFSITSIIFIGSKQQLAPIGIFAALILIRIFIKHNKKIFRYTAMVLSLIILASSFYLYRSISGDFDYINRYHAMTRGVLLNEVNPDNIMKQFNINRQYSMLQGTIYFDELPIIDPGGEKLKKEFYSKYSFFNVLTFYLKNPSAMKKMINLAVINGYSIRPRVIGNYEKNEGKPFGRQSHFFSMWSSIKENYIPHSLFLTVVVFGIYFVFAAKRYIATRKNGDIHSQLFEEAFLYVFLVGVSQIFISIIGAGDADLAKHVFMFNVTFDLMFLYSVCLIIKKFTVKGDKNEN